MAFKTTFQRLFALKLMHSFYLDGQSGAVFYDATSAEQQKILQKYDIRRDLTTLPTSETERLMKARHIRYATDERGFFVGIEMAIPDDNKPFLPLKEGEHIVFAVFSKNIYFQNITNMRLAVRDTMPLRYYFTNDQSTGKTYPSVSAPLKAFESRVYEMGECVRQATNIVWEATAKNNVFSEVGGAWQTFSGTFHDYVHAGDQQALPKRFSLLFETLTVKQLKAELKDMAGNSLKIIEIDSSVPLSSVNLDFLNYTTTITEGAQTKEIKVPVRDGAYKLSVAGDFVFAEQTVFLFDALSERNCVGIVDIVHKSGLNSSFRIQEADETLPTVLPEFEVRFQNRLTFRHFFDNTRKTIQTDFNTALDTDFAYNSGVLVRQKADRLARAPLKLRLNSGLVLPEPMDLNLAQNTDKTQFLSEIQF